MKTIKTAPQYRKKQRTFIGSVIASIKFFIFTCTYFSGSIRHFIDKDLF